MRRPNDQVLRGLRMLAKLFDDLAGEMPDRVSAQELRDMRSAARWCINMWDVCERRRRIEQLRLTNPAWPVDPDYATKFRKPAYAPARRRRG